jgi:hypothetical protein
LLLKWTTATPRQQPRGTAVPTFTLKVIGELPAMLLGKKLPRTE